MDESLRGEAAEEPLNDAMLQMQVNHVLVHRAGVVENYRSDW
jgi:hypothetical protein